MVVYVSRWWGRSMTGPVNAKRKRCPLQPHEKIVQERAQSRGLRGSRV